MFGNVSFVVIISALSSGTQNNYNPFAVLPGFWYERWDSFSFDWPLCFFLILELAVAGVLAPLARGGRTKRKASRSPAQGQL